MDHYTASEVAEIRKLLTQIPPSRWLVDVGANDGHSRSNVLWLIQDGWNAVLIEADPTCFAALKSNMAIHPTARPALRRVSLESGEDLDSILREANVPQDFDLLNIDIDGNDYWVWKSLTFQPKIVSIEYNSDFDPDESKGIQYDRDFRWSRDSYYGASARAFVQLGERKGYMLAGVVPGANLFFVRKDLACGIKAIPMEELYRKRMHPTTTKRFIDL